MDDFKNTVSIFEKAFKEKGLEEAWENVIGVVVQPGLEEKDSGCTEYDSEKATDLMASIKQYDNLVFEGHSTDYQTKYKLRQLIEDGVGVLKVGPGLTFQMREGLFALAYAEKEVFKNQEEKQSHLMEVLDTVMKKEPKYYNHHYYGTEDEIAYKRKFSFSDRSRYYMPLPEVQSAIQTLFTNFKGGVPLGVLSQFMPIEYTKVREGKLQNKPLDLVKDRVINTIDEYLYATHQEELTK